ncbi:cysteine hydrolase [Rhodovulum sp. 12E13]|uniref:isochorismatase family protein n=1 Tax=Rhodovulum sp. 12E13 TaxID=2203891 RepID=UPI000E15AA15|nr:cysteine hydrolase [Rhodovulum sp. 12E13]RDC71227.1 cysteine hydrolase [Rhodovulum sp. 12E13]
MHEVKIPDYIVERVVERRGKVHIHDDLDPAKTALLVVDLQNAFMVEEHAAAFVPGCVDIVPNVNRLAEAVRATGGKVFWIRNTITDESREAWSHWFAMTGHDAERAAQRQANMVEGAVGHELYPELVVKPEDETVLKHRFSALIQGSSDLHERLQAAGIETVIVTGTVTSVCCESTARDAMMLNYKTIMVSDGNAAMTDAEHNAALTAFYATFGDVMDTESLIDTVQANVTQAAAQ